MSLVIYNSEKKIQSPIATINPAAVKSKIPIKGSVPVVCPNLQDTDVATKDPVVAVKTVKPRRLSSAMASSASLNEMDLVEVKIRVRTYAAGQQPKRFISTPNIWTRTPTEEIRTPHDTTVQT